MDSFCFAIHTSHFCANLFRPKMEHAYLKFCFFLLLAIFLPTRVFGEPKAPCFFIFGDSVVDNGNNNYRETTAKVNYLPYGVDFPTGPTGRFSNGRNVADFIAELLGFDKYIPPYANGTTQDILQGVNYGSGGAGILDETGRQKYGDVISLNEQLSNHEATISRVTNLLGSKAAAKQHLSKCIYFVGMGNNDYLAYYLPQFHTSTTPYNPQQFAALLIFRYSTQLRRLYDNGARKIAVSGVGKLGCLPHEIATYGNSDAPACVETSNDVVRIFNEFLELLLKDLNNQLTDAKFVLARDSSSTTSYGNITVLSDTCCQVSTDVVSGGHCVQGTTPCSNRDEYMFWDGFHPTEAANLISAKIVYNDMSPLYADNNVIAIM
ncbi:GDSL esterase/lipase at1g29660 [Phtheirospermum japonicum]|uniref:GDSL esterase/lipase at1g29660 n=1 Tax=Phtheirospermum japonicum TaxID=374723 RepID=A0A830D2S2_9LAMI|nr:GDSL esterase/lipase at1g29660 [Phtheirospermum japonicum]